MSTMQTFHTVLSSDSKPPDQYLEALAAVAALGLNQLKALTSDLGWQDWN